MVIKELEKEAYQGQKFKVSYKTKGYFDLKIQNDTFQMIYKSFDNEKTVSFDDKFFDDWLETPCAFGIFENNRLLGYVEGAVEGWNNRYRISNICIFDESRRKQGLGGLLMQRILQSAKESGARMAVLETQSCNENAIAFYKKHGFRIIGFDLYAYSNIDPERHEIRLEMGLKLH